MIASPLQTEPYALKSGEGQRLELAGSVVVIKATSEQTGGAFNLFEVTCSSDYTIPQHIHYVEDVVIYVLEGALTLFWGDEKKEAVVGSFFFQPRGTPHGFRVKGNAPARILCMTIPAGFDRFVIEEELLAPQSESEMVAARHKIEILGPLPE